MFRLLCCLLLLLSPELFAADAGISALKVTTGPDGAQEYSVTLQVLALMTMLSFLPAMLIMTTSFTRIMIVLAILRQALGLQQSPSNQIMVGMALFLTFFIMAPTFKQVNEQAVQPYLNEQMTSVQALDAAIVPMKAFMLHQTRTKDLETFAEIAGHPAVKSVDEYPITIVIPAFVTSELKTAFQIGFMIFIPFLIIDLVVASVLMAMGMMMLSPMIISLPFKLMMFVLVDGWLLVMGTLANSYGIGT